AAPQPAPEPPSRPAGFYCSLVCLLCMKWVRSDPVLCNIAATCHPDAIVLLYVVKKPLQPGEPSGPPNKATVQPHRHHAGRMGAFCVKHIEGVAQVTKKLLCRMKPLRGGKTHIVGIERIGHNKVRLPGSVATRNRCPKRQV